MTKPKPLPEIARCACGLRVDSLESDSHHHRVWCFCGWKGPWRATVRGAILAWNRVMQMNQASSERLRMHRIAVRQTVCDRIEAVCYTKSGLIHNMYLPIIAELKKIRRGE